jgi:hypothetical protein
MRVVRRDLTRYGIIRTLLISWLLTVRLLMTKMIWMKKSAIGIPMLQRPRFEHNWGHVALQDDLKDDAGLRYILALASIISPWIYRRFINESARYRHCRRE